MSPLKIVLDILINAIIVNIGLGVFNLIPIPPLDGSKVLMHFLPYNAKVWFGNNEGTFIIVFMLLWITGIAGSIISPIINGMYTGLMSIMTLLF